MKKPSFYVTLVFATLLGGLGADRFYTGSWGLGLLKLFTGGLGGVWWVVDVILLLLGVYGDEFDEPVLGNEQDDKIEKNIGFSLRMK